MNTEIYNYFNNLFYKFIFMSKINRNIDYNCGN